MTHHSNLLKKGGEHLMSKLLTIALAAALIVTLGACASKRDDTAYQSSSQRTSTGYSK